MSIPFLRFAFRFLVCGLVLTGAPVRAQVLPGTDIVVFSLSWNDRERPVLSQPMRVTDRAGYDNQPSFSRDGAALYYSSQLGNQTDIYRYSFASGTTLPLTGSPESEYSPQEAADGSFVYAVRVELPDSVQRLWRFPLDGGKPRLVMDAIEPVGYYAWLNEALVGVFVLGLDQGYGQNSGLGQGSSLGSGQGSGLGSGLGNHGGQRAKNTLQIGPAAKQKMRVIGADIGRCLARVPGREALSFVQLQEDAPAMLRVYDAQDQRVKESVPLLADAQDYAWTPDQHLLMGSGNRLYVSDAFGEARWHFAVDLGELLPVSWQLQDISRLAVSPDGQKLAVVLNRSGD